MHLRLARWTLLLFVVASIMLIGSVVLPARESGRVLALLDEDERVLEPLRLLSSRLGAGIADEAADLQGFRNTGDAAALVRFQRTRARDDSSTASIHDLSTRVGGNIAAEAESLGALIARWRHAAGVSPGAYPVATSPTASGVQRGILRDSVQLSIGRVQADLVARSADRRTAVAEHERRGVVINAAQVLIALVTLAALFEVLRRERRRARREAALRGVAESLALAFDKQDVAQRVATGALELLSATSVSVAHVENVADAGQLTFAAAAGASRDASGTMTIPFADAEGERAGRDERPSMMAAAAIGHAGWARQRAMVIPLGTAHAPIGAVIAFESSRFRFHQDDLAWARILGHLASFAYERVRLLDEARAGEAGLQRVIDSRGRLIRGFSHDLKNPLGAADGYAALLQDGIYGTVSEEQFGSIARVREAIHRALSLIEDLHELARAETGRLDLQRERVDLSALVRAAAEEYRATAAVKRLRFVVDAASELPRVDTDPSRVRQIIGNLLSNAIKYTDSGTVTLRARAQAAAPPDEATHLLVEVQDTGPGIPPDKQGFIFDEFARLADGRHPGAGVGLAISKHVAEALGCRLDVASAVGQGATFTLRIPLSSDASDSSRDPARPTTEGTPDAGLSREVAGAPAP